MLNIARIALTTCLLAAAPSFAECPTTTHNDDLRASFAALASEIEGYGPLQDTGFSIGSQQVYRLQPTAEAGDALLDRLRRLAPRIEELQAEVGLGATRAVVLIESWTDGFGGTLAFTNCTDAHAPHWLEESFSDMDALPEGACMIVMFPERLGGSRMTDFALAHEWMHTMQTAAFKQSVDGDKWWREGSADWFGHRVVPGATERNPVIERFFTHQPECELVKHSYDTQVFFFWADAVFGPEWVFGQGLTGQDWLTKPELAAQIMRSDHWLDWVMAQADGEIAFPDGRPLPAGPDIEPLQVGKSCNARITAPALSATFREVTLSDAASGALRIDSGASRVAIRDAGGDWRRLAGSEVIDPPPASPFLLAAISPSADRLEITLSPAGSGGDECTCYAGRWMELESAENDQPFRFRSGMANIIANVPGASINYDTAGPVLTIGDDGRVTIDNPHAMSFPNATIRYTTYQTYGTWTAENGPLEIDLEGKEIEANVSSDTVSGVLDVPDASTLGVGGKWIPTCNGDRLTLSTWMVNPSDPPKDTLHFVRPE